MHRWHRIDPVAQLQTGEQIKRPIGIRAARSVVGGAAVLAQQDGQEVSGPAPRLVAGVLQPPASHPGRPTS
jgi:hypothetical protein